MKKELQDELRKKYKWLEKNMSDKHPYPMFGFEVGDGWYALLDDLCFEIDRIFTGDPDLEKNFYVAQIKEKFGGLRFYIYGGNDEIDARISEAEDKSYKICEDCGKKGKVNNTGWRTTLCSKCRKDSKNK